MRHLTVLFFFAFFSFAVPVTAFALSNPVPDSDPSVSETTILTSAAEDIQKEIVILEKTDPLTNDDFPEENFYIYFDSDGRPHMLEIEWNLDEDALGEPGLHEVTGYPILPEGMVLEEGYDGSVTWPVFRKGGMTKLELIYAALPSIPDCILAYGEDPYEALSPNKTINYFLTEQDWVLTASKNEEFWIEWDYSEIDSEILGTYSVIGTVHYPDWAELSEEYQQKDVNVYVLPTDSIEIYAFTSYDRNGKVEVRWLYDCESVSDVILEQQTEEDEWEACDASWYRFIDKNLQRNACLLLYFNEIPRETEHILRLRYTDHRGGTAQIRYSLPVSLTVPENYLEILQSTGQNFIIEVIEGDRDGSDTSSEPDPDLPDYSQPAPENPSESDSDIPSGSDPGETTEPEWENNPDKKPAIETIPGKAEKDEPGDELENDLETEPETQPEPDININTGGGSGSSSSSENSDRNDSDNDDDDSDDDEYWETTYDSDTEITEETVWEEVTSTTTRISGFRLQQMIDAGSTVLFEKMGVSAEIPSTLLSSLALDHQDILEVTILRPQERQISLSVTANGTPVEILNGTVIWMPWDSKETKLICHDQHGKRISDVVYDGNARVIRFTVSQSGTYSVTAPAEKIPGTIASASIADRTPEASSKASDSDVIPASADDIPSSASFISETEAAVCTVIPETTSSEILSAPDETDGTYASVFHTVSAILAGAAALLTAVGLIIWRRKRDE